MKITFYLVIFIPTVAFQCFQCNNGVNENDVKPCIDQKTECPKDTKSCSTVFYASEQSGEIHMRKFCTSPSIPVSQYLRLFPNNAFCQNTLTNQDQDQFTSLLKRRRRDTSPPAPPRRFKNNLLCLCATPLCNNGIRKEIMDRIISDPSRHNTDLSLQELND